MKFLMKNLSPPLKEEAVQAGDDKKMVQLTVSFTFVMISATQSKVLKD